MSEINDSYTTNVKKLIIWRFSMLVIPPGSKRDSSLVGLRIFSDKDRFLKLWQEAEKWTREALLLVKNTHDNPWGDDDEAIAKALLVKLENKNV